MSQRCANKKKKELRVESRLLNEKFRETEGKGGGARRRVKAASGIS